MADSDEVAEWIQQECLDRLAEASRAGLGEAVLVASVAHRGSEEFGQVASHQVLAALKVLKAAGRVDLSARRWRRKR